MNGAKPANKSSALPTLVEIRHPEFRRGYQEGRLHSLQENMVITDKYIVESLHEPFYHALLEQGVEEEIEADLYYAVGYVLGEMSVHTIPHQPQEESTAALKERNILSWS